MKPVLKAPVYTLLKLRYDGPLSSFAFKFNLRHYSKTHTLAALIVSAAERLARAGWMMLATSFATSQTLVS